MDLQTVKAVIMGHAVADALGVPVEFASRKELDNVPVTEMQGYGTYSMPKGSWSDDTSMVVCELEALAKYGLNYEQIMVNFGKWFLFCTSGFIVSINLQFV